jgi:hypothetical protein
MRSSEKRFDAVDKRFKSLEVSRLELILMEAAKGSYGP